MRNLIVTFLLAGGLLCGASTLVEAQVNLSAGTEVQSGERRDVFAIEGALTSKVSIAASFGVEPGSFNVDSYGVSFRARPDTWRFEPFFDLYTGRYRGNFTVIAPGIGADVWVLDKWAARYVLWPTTFWFGAGAAEMPTGMRHQVSLVRSFE